ncbi:MAG: imidazole glycerol phosphate synthase subunit HisH [Planctomycetota bacterium]
MRGVVVISTGAANTASVAAAFHRLGCETTVTTDATLVREAERVVLPGVGSFQAGMNALRAHGLDDVVRARVDAERPLLCICLGMQLLATQSEESPGVVGLGIVQEAVRRLSAEARVPQFGWNAVDARETTLLRTGHAYYANSYCIQSAPDGWRAATSTHGTPFVAALERGPVLACQFHPELSGSWGAGLLERWLKRAEATVPC